MDSSAVMGVCESQIRLPYGLLGFEHIQDFVLLANPGEEPFQWLQVKDDPTLAFLVVSPFIVMPDYRPNLPEGEIGFLKLKGPEDAVVFNIVTMTGMGQATLNLKGPIVVNRHTQEGRQVIPINAAQYSVCHPLSTSVE